MWHLSNFVRSIATRKHKWLPVIGSASLGSMALVLGFQPAHAQSNTPANAPAPTVRYARGENVGLEEIVTEWRGYYADVPIYQCVCQADICDQSDGWPYREYDRYQLSVTLGPNNGKAAESVGFNCFDIADGSRPTKPRNFSAEERDPNDSVATARPRIPAPPSPAAPPSASPAVSEAPASVPAVVSTPPVAPPDEPPTSTEETQASLLAPSSSPAIAAASTQASSDAIPQAAVINNGAAIQLNWPSGRSDVIAVAESSWNLNVLDALDCESLSVVEEKLLEAQQVVAIPAVDNVTGNVAIPVLLDSCVETDQSAVFIITPNEGGGYALYRAQLPGAQTFPNEFSTYAFSSITGIQYWDGYLLVRQSNAAGAEAISVFLPGNTPAGEYGGCGVVRPGEGASVLCEN